MKDFHLPLHSRIVSSRIGVAPACKKNESNRSKVESRKIDSESPSESHPIDAQSKRPKKTVLLVDHAFARVTLAIFVIFVVCMQSEQQIPCFSGHSATSSFSPFSSKTPSCWQGIKARLTKSTVLPTPTKRPWNRTFCVAMENGRKDTKNYKIPHPGLGPENRKTTPEKNTEDGPKKLALCRRFSATDNDL